MRILWSPDLSLASPTLALFSPQIVGALEGDDLQCYCAARFLTKDLEVFRPGSLARLTENVKYESDGTPVIDDEEWLMEEFSVPLMHFGVLKRMLEHDARLIPALLHAPEAVPPEVVASFFGHVPDRAEQEQRHSELVAFVQDIVTALPGGGDADPYFFTADPLLARLYLEAQPVLGPRNTLALLATSGITFGLPRVAASTEGQLDEVHERVKQQRERFLAELNSTISECYEALKSGNIAEAYRFAEFRVATKLQSEAALVEQAVNGLDASLLKRLKIRAIKGLPAVASSLSSPVKLGAKVLEILCGALAEHWTSGRDPLELAEKFPLGSFTYAIRRELNASGEEDPPAPASGMIVGGMRYEPLKKPPEE